MNEPKKAPSGATESADMQSLERHAQDTAELEGVSLESAWGDEDPTPQVLERRPPGLVGDIATYVYCRAFYPSVEAAVLAALGLMAGIAGRAYKIKGDGLNLYLLLLAPTGRGKEAMQKGIERLVTEVRDSGVPGVEDFIGSGGFASGQALVREIGEHPSFISVFGEFGLRLKALSDPRTNPAEQMQLKTLLDLYNKSSTANTLRPQSYADRDKNTKCVRSPALSILGESSPEVVYENIGIREISSGLLPRFLILDGDTPRPDENQNANCAPPKELVDKLRNVVAAALTANAAGSTSPPVETDVQIDEAATQVLDGIKKDLNETYHSDPNPVERELWNRALQNIRRVAALLAVGINHVNPVVTEECARWASDFVYRCIENLVDRFRAGFIGTGDTRQEAEVKKYVREYMRMKPLKRIHSYRVPKSIASESELIPLSYLRRRAKQCTAFTQDRRDLNAALKSTLAAMVDAGLLVKVNAVQLQQRFGSHTEVYAPSSDETFYD